MTPEKSEYGKAGFIPLLRKAIRTHPLFESGKFKEFALFLFLLLEAAPKEKPIWLGTKKYYLKRGALIRSQKNLAKIFNCNRKTIKKRLCKLAQMGDILVESVFFAECNKTTIISILHYDKYVWKMEKGFQDTEALMAAKGYVPFDRENILSMKAFKLQKYSEWIFFFYLCLEAIHSRTEIDIHGKIISIGRGQLARTLEQLAWVMKCEEKKIYSWLKKYSKKKILSFKTSKTGAGQETLIISIDSYDLFTRKFRKMDNELDNVVDIEMVKDLDHELVSSENVFSKNVFDNFNKKKREVLGMPPAASCTSLQRSGKMEVEEQNQEEKNQLLDEIMEWTFSPFNNFKERTGKETLQKQLTHVINKIGIEKTREIFVDISEAERPWGNPEFDNLSALTEFWERLKTEMEYIKNSEPVQQIILPEKNINPPDDTLMNQLENNQPVKSVELPGAKIINADDSSIKHLEKRRPAKIVKVPEKKYLQSEDSSQEALFLLENLTDYYSQKIGIKTVMVCLLLDQNYIGWTGYSLNRFKIEHAEVLTISKSTMERIFKKLFSLGLVRREKLSKRVEFDPIWNCLKIRFIEKKEALLRQNN